MPRILFVTQHRPDRSPGQRFRYEQYLAALAADGWQYDLSPIVSAEDDRILYSKGNYWDKARFVARCELVRRKDVARMDDYDVIFIYREALMTRGIRYEQRFRRSRAKLVFDFDDSIWLSNVSDANRRFNWMKDAGKTSRIIGLCDQVFAGNAYLSDYARAYNPNVTVVPTTIDTDEYRPRAQRPEGPVVIGWSGSITTIQHFRFAVPALQAIKQKFGDRVVFRVVGDGAFRMPELGVEGLPWRKDTELDDLRAMDIGIMPLPDDAWARGKCGLKGLQYMALGIPTLMSPVGVNTDILTDGENGFLPADTDEWVARLARLVEDAELRRRMGASARATVVEHYSLQAWKQRYVGLFNALIDRRTHGDIDRTQEDRAHRHA